MIAYHNFIYDDRKISIIDGEEYELDYEDYANIEMAQYAGITGLDLETIKKEYEYNRNWILTVIQVNNSLEARKNKPLKK